MNYLVLLPEEISSGKATILGPKAADLIKLHDLKEGLKVAALEFNGNRGSAFVEKCLPDILELTLDLSEPALEKNDIHLIIGLCRPQSVKKVISAAVCTGAKSIHFVRSAHSEKSYLDSGIWEESKLQEEIILGMAQSGDSIAPEIILHQRFKPFLEDYLPRQEYFNTSRKILVDLEGEEAILKSSSSPLVLSVGPEKGWNDYEKERFKSYDFQIHSLGKRVLRTEQALIFALGRIA